MADIAYFGRPSRQGLQQQGVIEAIASKRNRGQAKLFDWQERWNTLTARYRARLEHPFAMLKQQLGCRRTRYRGLVRNAFDFVPTIAAYNFKRSLSLRVA